MAPLSNPIGVGSVIRRVLAVYANRGVLVISVALTISVATAALDTLVRGVRVASLLSLPIGHVGGAVLTGMLVALFADMQDARGDAGVKKLALAVRPVLWRLIIVSFVAGLGEIIGLFLIVIPGLLLLTIWAVYAPVVVLEHPPGLVALDRSRELVRGNGWRVFAVVFVPFILKPAIGIGTFFAHHPEAISTAFVVPVVTGTLIAPVAALLSASLYFELRRSAT